MTVGPGDDPALRRSLMRWKRAGAVALFVLLLAFPVYRFVEGGRRDEALASRQIALTTAGMQLWEQNCAACHGMTGQGVDAPALNSLQFLQNVTDEQIHHITAAGIAGTEMPAWWNEFSGSLTDEQIRAVVAFVRSWEPTAADRPDWRSPGVELPGEAEREQA